MKLWILITVVALSLLAGGFWFVHAKGSAVKNPSVETTTVKPKTFISTVSSSGKTRAQQSVDLKFQTSGRLAWVGVKEGDMVDAYTAIAGMDVREVQKNLEKALRDYSTDRSAFEDTQLSYQNRAPQQALNDVMKRVLERNQWNLEQAVLDVELKHLAVEYATLVTPISGIVTHIDTPVAGVNITPASAVFQVMDPVSIVFEANVDEIDVGKLQLGQSAQVSLDAYELATFSGKISYISYTSQTSSGGATVFPVKIAFDDPVNLRIGLNGDVSIVVEQQENVLVVPNEAIRQQDGASIVYKKTSSGYERTPVVTGSHSDEETVVLDGIEPGDVLVTKGFSAL